MLDILKNILIGIVTFVSGIFGVGVNPPVNAPIPAPVVQQQPVQSTTKTTEKRFGGIIQDVPIIVPSGTPITLASIYMIAGKSVSLNTLTSEVSDSITKSTPMPYQDYQTWIGVAQNAISQCGVYSFSNVTNDNLIQKINNQIVMGVCP